MNMPMAQTQEAQTQRHRPPPPAESESNDSPAGVPPYLREATTGPDAEATGEASTPAEAEGTEEATSGEGDACDSLLDQIRRAMFLASSFSELDFRPSAGYGKFDAYYWPSSSLMSVVVKMHFNYIPADNTPSMSTLISMLLAGQDISRFFWTPTQEAQFARDYEQRIADRWSFAHTFRSTKPCWPFYVEPYVHARVVEDEDDAHFNVDVHKSAGPGIDYSSGFRARNPGTAGWQGTGNLYSSDVQEESDFNSVAVARSERQRLERAIAAAHASPVMFDNNSATVSSTYRTRLRTLADAMKLKNPSDPDIPVVFNGYASMEGGRTHNERLSRQRAEAVANELRSAGVSQPLVITPHGPVGTAGDVSNRKVEVAPSTSFETTYSSNRYSVAEHEFGHTLGLPDEYVNYTTGDLGTKQTAFVNLARAAGVEPPDRWGDTTASQMSAGVDVLPRHYLTIWEALGAMTASYITRNEWSID